MSNPESPEDVPWRLVRLRHAVQRLALPGEMQLASLPDFVCKTDEILLDLDHWREVALQWHAHEFSPEQRSSLARLDALLDDLTESSASDDAVRSAPEWARVRVQAQVVLAAFAWPAEAPPSYAHEYVSGTSGDTEG